MKDGLRGHTEDDDILFTTTPTFNNPRGGVLQNLLDSLDLFSSETGWPSKFKFCPFCSRLFNKLLFQMLGSISVRDFRAMTATIANEDSSLRESAPLAMNHSHGTNLKSYFRKRTQEKNTLMRHVRKVLGDEDDESDTTEVSAAVQEMREDEEATAETDTSTEAYDPIDRPLGERTALFPKERTTLMQVLPPHPKVKITLL